MCEAILTFSEQNLTNTIGYRKLVFYHWILQTIAGIAITIGFTAIFIGKIRRNKDHFTTNHGLIGFIAVVCTGISILGGIMAKYSFQLRHWIRPVYSKISHGVFGVISLFLGLVAILLGLVTHWFIDETSTATRYTIFVVVLLTGIYCLIRPIRIVLTRIASLFG